MQVFLILFSVNFTVFQILKLFSYIELTLFTQESLDKISTFLTYETFFLKMGIFVLSDF